MIRMRHALDCGSLPRGQDNVMTKRKNVYAELRTHARSAARSV